MDGFFLSPLSDRFYLVDIETNQESKKVDPYSCAIKAFVGQSPQFKTVRHILREISSHVFFFLKEQNGKFEESVYSAGGLEIPIFLTFKSTCSVTHQKIKTIGPSAPVRCVPVASPVDNFAGTASLVSNYGFRTNEWKISLPGHKEPLSTVLFGETGCPH